MTPKINLTLGQRFAVMQFIKEAYTAKAMTDGEFANYAAGQLGIPTLNANHIGTCREALGILATKYAAQVNKPETRLALIERRLLAVEDLANRLRSSLEAQGVTI